MTNARVKRGELKPFTLYMEPDLLEWLKEGAAKTQRSRTKYIIHLLTEQRELYYEKYGPPPPKALPLPEPPPLTPGQIEGRKRFWGNYHKKE